MFWFATMVKDKEFSRRSVEWAITSKCNLRCKHCYMGSEAHVVEKELDYKDIKKTANKVLKHAKIVVISGGEPLVYKKLFDIIKILDQKVDVVLATNGTVYNQKTILQIKESNIKAVQVSLESSKADYHDDFRGIKGSWDKTVGFIKHMNEINMPVVSCFTCTSKNYQDFNNYVELVRSLKIKSIYITRFIPVGIGLKNLQYSIEGKDEIDFLNNYLKPNAAKFKDYISTSDPKWNHYIASMNEESVGCSMGHMLFINSIGDISPCPMVDIKLGNVLKEELDEIYNKKEMKGLKDKKMAKGICKDCDKKKHCGGCLAWQEYLKKRTKIENDCIVRGEENDE